MAGQFESNDFLQLAKKFLFKENIAFFKFQFWTLTPTPFGKLGCEIHMHIHKLMDIFFYAKQNIEYLDIKTYVFLYHFIMARALTLKKK